MPSGILKTTGCENPKVKFNILPDTDARYPTPKISNLRSNPSLTPLTILASYELL